MESTTTNSSESFDCVLKRLQDWREVPVDAMALSLYRLPLYQLLEIRRGRCGLGNFNLRCGREQATWTNQAMNTVTLPIDIVDQILSGSATIPNNDDVAQTSIAGSSRCMLLPSDSQSA